MTDVRLTCKSQEGRNSFVLFDLAHSGSSLELDDSMETAVIISLFTDRKANDDDELPSGDDRRGWWADSFAEVEGDLIGSRLWLLKREKQLLRVLAKAKIYAEEALKWLIDDGIAEKVTVTPEIVKRGIMGLLVEIEKPGVSPLKYKYNYIWEAA